ncbi:MAG: hypothetical protein IPL40_12845 [Proteobacteria bacterium]|nr:hypothetical protein [Pseudomonadota bacterium]
MNSFALQHRVALRRRYHSPAPRHAAGGGARPSLGALAPALSAAAALVLLLSLSGCSGDAKLRADASTTLIDQGPTLRCPSAGPTPLAQQHGACCYRRANADRQARPEYRVAGLQFNQPQSLANTLLTSITTNSIDEERFNWLFALEGADDDGPLTIRTGSARRQSDGSFSFTHGTGGLGGGIDWEPITIEGSLLGATWQGGPASRPVALVIFNPDGEHVDAELPIRELRIIRAVMAADRDCIGRRLLTSYDTEDGEISGYLTLEDAGKVFVGIGGLDPIRLCMVLLGSPAASGECTALPRKDWTFPPDARCDAGGCQAGGCDPLSDCNAWVVRGTFAAQGVEVE